MERAFRCSTLVPRFRDRPAASLRRLFQSKAVLSAFSTARVPLHEEQGWQRRIAEHRAKVATNSARWVACMSVGRFAGRYLGEQPLNPGSSTMPGGLAPSGADAKLV